MEELGVYEKYKPDIVLYDVLGDVVCGGFAMPIRGGYADNVFIVTSGEMMSLYAATNIVTAIENFAKRGYAKFSGLILNKRNIENELEVAQKAASEMNGEIICVIERDNLIQVSENQGKTVVELFPESNISKVYENLARKVLEVCNG